jgi:hypothetical protein
MNGQPVEPLCEFAGKSWNQTAAIDVQTGQIVNKTRLMTLPLEFIVSAMDDSQLASPYGRIIFDSSGVKFNARAHVLQITDIDASPLQIVAPTELAQTSRVKIAPLWNQREYVRKPFGSVSHEIGQIILLTLQGIFLGSICITAFKYRGVPEVEDVALVSHLFNVFVCVLL